MQSLNDVFSSFVLFLQYAIKTKNLSFVTCFIHENEKALTSLLTLETKEGDFVREIFAAKDLRDVEVTLAYLDNTPGICYA